MTLHWGSSHISSCLPDDLVARFSEAYADPTSNPSDVTGLPVYNGKTGEFIIAMAAEKPCRVSRKKMRNLFSEGLDVRYGKKFIDAAIVDEKIVVQFADGTSATGDVLVACDGAKSLVRSTIVGEEKAKLTTVPVSMFNFPYKFDAALARRIRDMNELFITSIHPDHGTMFWLSSKSLLPLASTIILSLTHPSSRRSLPRPLNMDIPSPAILDKQQRPAFNRPLHPHRSSRILQAPRRRVRRALAFRRPRRRRRNNPPARLGHVLGRCT
jgi:hypothetical protein